MISDFGFTPFCFQGLIMKKKNRNGVLVIQLHSIEQLLQLTVCKIIIISLKAILSKKWCKQKRRKKIAEEKFMWAERDNSEEIENSILQLQAN